MLGARLRIVRRAQEGLKIELPEHFRVYRGCRSESDFLSIRGDVMDWDSCYSWLPVALAK